MIACDFTERVVRALVERVEEATERLFTIPSARNPQEINDSFAATELTLTQDELAMLNASVDARRG